RIAIVEGNGHRRLRGPRLGNSLQEFAQRDDAVVFPQIVNLGFEDGCGQTRINWYAAAANAMVAKDGEASGGGTANAARLAFSANGQLKVAGHGPSGTVATCS